jgi:hypothetical protein
VKSQHAPAERLQCRGPRRVVLGPITMLTAVQLNDQPRVQTGEIGEVTIDWDLPTEFEAAELAVAQDRPKLPFGVGRALAKLTGQGSTRV